MTNTIIENLAVMAVQEELLQAQSAFYATHEVIVTALKATGISEEKARQIVDRAVSENTPYIETMYAVSMKSKAEMLAEQAKVDSDKKYGGSPWTRG